MPLIPLTAKEVHILIQALRIAMEDENIRQLAEFAKAGEISQIRNKLQNVKDV